MKEYEVFLKRAIESRNERNSVNRISIEQSEREIVNKLKNLGLISNVRYMTANGVGFDLTYDGVHYFDE